MDPTTIDAVGQAATGTTAATTTTFDAGTLLRLLEQGGLTVYPLAIASILALAIVIERIFRFRGVEAQVRDLTRRVVDHLAKRDLAAARALCEASSAKNPMARVFVEGLRWQNIALEDLDRVLATSRQEAVSELRRGLWILGTIGSLSPFIGLFGTVVGIIRAFHEMAVQGSGGFAVVAAGISEALVATGTGLAVAIVALGFFNYLQVRVNAISSTFARSCERFIQALLYVESSAGSAAAPPTPPIGSEAHRGHPLPA